MQVKKAPRFMAVAGSKANDETSSVDILFEASDGEHYAVEFDPGMIAPMLTAITGHANELLSSQSDRFPVQAMPVKRVGVAMSPGGGVSLELVLESNLRTLLAFDKQQLPALRSVLTEIHDLVSREVQ